MYNPGNIRNADGSFKDYDNPKAGYDALVGDLTAKIGGSSPAMQRNLGAGYVPTIQNLLNVYAPPTENNTPNYVDFVSKQSGIPPNTPLTSADVQKIAYPMIVFEQGHKNAEPYKQYTDAGNSMNDATAPQTFDLELPNGQVLQGVPAGTTKAQITAKLAAKGISFDSQPSAPSATESAALSQPSAASDLVKTIGSNLAKGVVDTAMILPNIANAAVAGPQYLYEGLIGQDRKDFKPYQPFFSSEDVVSGSAIDYAPKTTAGKLAEIPARLAGGMVAPSVINKTANKVFPGERPTAIDKKAQAQAKYDTVEKSGAVLDDTVYQDFLQNAQKIRPQNRIQQATGARDAFDDALDEVSKVASVKDMSINEVKQLDERLTALAEKARNNGAGTAESRLINQLKYKWRETIEDAAQNGKVSIIKNGQKTQDPIAVDAWRGAVKDYATANRAKDVELIIERAKLTDNPAMSIKTGMRNLYIRIQKGTARGYTTEQANAIKHAADTGIFTGLARVMGSRLNPIVALSSSGLDAGIIQGLTSKAARDFATKSQTGRANKVLDSLLGDPAKDPIAAAWAARNQEAAMRAVPFNLGAELMTPVKEVKK